MPWSPSSSRRFLGVVSVMNAVLELVTRYMGWESCEQSGIHGANAFPGYGWHRNQLSPTHHRIGHHTDALNFNLDQFPSLDLSIARRSTGQDDIARKKCKDG